eukprot:3766529-Amphidinium_carterae.1
MLVYRQLVCSIGHESSDLLKYKLVSLKTTRNERYVLKLWVHFCRASLNARCQQQRSQCPLARQL